MNRTDCARHAIRAVASIVAPFDIWRGQPTHVAADFPTASFF